MNRPSFLDQLVIDCSFGYLESFLQVTSEQHLTVFCATCIIHGKFQTDKILAVYESFCLSILVCRSMIAAEYDNPCMISE